MSKVSPSASMAFSCVNLAMCRLKQEKPYDAISACDRALEADDSAGKAWYRRGQACMALQQYVWYTGRIYAECWAEEGAPVVAMVLLASFVFGLISFVLALLLPQMLCLTRLRITSTTSSTRR